MISPNAEWIRLPKPKAKCSVTSLSRTSLSELCRTVDESGAPVIKTVRLKKPGAKREMLLINRESLLRFLEATAAEQAARGKLRLVSDTHFTRFTEQQIAQSRELWTWAVNPPFFPELDQWLVGRFSSVDVRLNMMARVGLTWSDSAEIDTRAAAESTTRPPRASKRYDRIIRDWSKLTDIQRLNYWGPVCNDISKRAESGWDLQQLSPSLFVSYVHFICLANFGRGADTPFPDVLKSPRKATKFAPALRVELENIACNAEQREALGALVSKAELLIRIHAIEPITEPEGS